MDRIYQKHDVSTMGNTNRAGKVFFFALLIVLFTIGCSPLAIPKNFIPQLKSAKSSAPPQNKLEENTQMFSVGFRISSLDISSDSRYIAVNFLKEKMSDPDDPNQITYHCQTELWNIENVFPHREAREDLMDLSWVDSACFDLGGKEYKLLISAKESFRGPAHVHLLDIAKKKHFQSFLSDSFSYRKFRLFKGNHWIACEDYSGYWHLISREDQKRKIFFPEIGINDQSDQLDSKGSNSDSTSLQGKYLVSEVLAISREGDLVATLVVPSGNRIQKNKKETNYGNTQSVEESISGNKRLIVIWDLKVAGSVPLKSARLPLEAIKISHFKVEDGIEPRKCEFSSRGDIIAVRSKSKYVGLWETANGRLISELGEHEQRIQAIAFAPNSLKLAVATGGERGRLILWDIRKESIYRTYEDPNPKCKKITAISYASDGRSIYYGTEDGDIKVFDLKLSLIN